jgi:hypothetical protein
MTDTFSPNVRDYFAHLDTMIARDPSDERRLLKINIDVWDRREAMVAAWAAKGGKGTCPVPPGWSAFDITSIRLELMRRQTKAREAA